MRQGAAKGLKAGLVGVVLLITACKRVGLPCRTESDCRAGQVCNDDHCANPEPIEEARGAIRRIYEGAKAYYSEDRMPAGSYRDVARQFPATVTMTPPRGACCLTHDKRCKPDLKQWDHPSWTELAFKIAVPHVYSYEFVSFSTGGSSRFTARAVGDVDCDGVFSTFEAVGSIDAEGVITGDPIIQATDESE